jgi:tetratricopeptide (TPR) repeat protein
VADATEDPSAAAAILQLPEVDALINAGQLDAATGLLSALLQAAVARHDVHTMGGIFAYFANLALLLLAPAEAIAHLEMSIQLFQSVSDLRSVARLCWSAGLLCGRQKDYATAIAYLKRAAAAAEAAQLAAAARYRAVLQIMERAVDEAEEG